MTWSHSLVSPMPQFPQLCPPGHLFFLNINQYKCNVLGVEHSESPGMSRPCSIYSACPPEALALIPCLLWSQDALISLLSRSQLHFIHCLVPTSVESKPGQGTPSPPQPGGDQGGANEPPALDIPAMRVQLAGSHILEALRLHRAGKKQMGTRCPCPGSTHYVPVSHRTGTIIICQMVIEQEHPLCSLRCAHSEKS